MTGTQGDIRAEAQKRPDLVPIIEHIDIRIEDEKAVPGPPTHREWVTFWMFRGVEYGLATTAPLPVDDETDAFWRQHLERAFPRWMRDTLLGKVDERTGKSPLELTSEEVRE